MRIISWNCLGAFRRKARHLDAFKPDLVVIQECERLDRLVLEDCPQPRDAQWFSDPGAKKGLGIFAYSDLRLQLADDIYDPSIRYCVPLRVTGRHSFNLVAVWAMDGSGEDRLRYIGQVVRALDKYRAFIREGDTLLVGDFNSNKIFDQPNREVSHSKVVEVLEQEGILSVYHDYFHEPQGGETRPTFYLYKNQARPFHLDYCFAPRDWCRRVEQVMVGDIEYWKQWSDHCPVMVEFRDA